METKIPKNFKEWYSTLEKDKLFNKSENRLKSNTYSQKFSVNDFSIRGHQEIVAFNKNFQKYSKITRRGLTFISDEKGNVEILRKGLPKFFDLSNKYIYKKNEEIKNNSEIKKKEENKKILKNSQKKKKKTKKQN